MIYAKVTIVSVSLRILDTVYHYPYSIVIHSMAWVSLGSKLRPTTSLKEKETLKQTL